MLLKSWLQNVRSALALRWDQRHHARRGSATRVELRRIAPFRHVIGHEGVQQGKPVVWPYALAPPMLSPQPGCRPTSGISDHPFSSAMLLSHYP
jgi:hypothetical protein